MAATGLKYWFGHVLLLIFIQVKFINAAFSIDYETPDQCRRGAADATHEFFDISQLRCRECAQGANFQTVSSDGLRCVCQAGMRLLQDFGGANILCDACGENQVASNDGWDCVSCPPESPFNPVTTECQACVERQVPVERMLNGSWYQGLQSRTCQTCAAKTAPNDEGTRCERCNQVLSVIPNQDDCQCPEDQQSGGVCFKTSDDVLPENEKLYEVVFSDSLKVQSAYFAKHIIAARGMCLPSYANLTACQALANMCVANLYYDGNFGSITPDACALYKTLQSDNNARIGGSSGGKQDWPENMPWLYYIDDTAETVLTDTRMTTQFTFPNSRLNFKVARYALNGTFLGISDSTGGLLQLCKSTQNKMDAAYVFGTSYSQSCSIPVRDLWDQEKYPAEFYDVYLEFESGGAKQLYAIPVLITNLQDSSGNLPNQKPETERRDWQLVRRFFLVDSSSGLQRTSSSSEDGQPVQQNTRARAVRYVQSMTLHIALQDNTNEGLIYPPYFQIQYAHVTDDDYSSDKTVQTSFEVKYSMNLEKHRDDVSIALGVLCALAVVYGAVLTWGWSRRAGKIAIDFFTLVKFVLFSIGSLANTFFVVSFGTALWWLIFFKRQNSVYLLLPSTDQERVFIAQLGTAFGLKVIQMLHMIVCQVMVDIFFIDWERPRGSGGHGEVNGKVHDSSVSIWRTYFIANEWNEIQTARKINSVFQIFTVVFFLNVIGFENLATSDPRTDFSLQEDMYYGPTSRICRFALGALVYLIVGVVQWILYTFIYQRFIEDKVRQYVDLCSMSNVSVFILENAQYGYYIHGRSVHGRADTGMREMHENLKREEEDLCGQRGLLPNTEQQTFQISVPKKLRNHYNRILLPISSPQQAGVANAPRGQSGPGGVGSHIDPRTEKSIQGYEVLNRLLQAFIDHSLRDTDYIIKDKLLFESILDTEFQDATDKGFFYNDDGHAFDSVLFFGNETTLIIFEILFFSIVDLIARNFVLAGVLTYVVMELIRMLRDSLGRSNLAKKTLVDKRFLI